MRTVLSHCRCKRLSPAEAAASPTCMWHRGHWVREMLWLFGAAPPGAPALCLQHSQVLVGECPKDTLAPGADPGVRPGLLVWLDWQGLVLSEPKDWEER